MKYITLLLSIALSVSAFAGDGGGPALPWPWPWAKECPIHFDQLNDTYSVKNSSLVRYIRILTYWDKYRGKRYLSIELYNADLDLLSQGETYLYGGERSVYVPMNSYDVLGVKGLYLRIYFKSAKRSCETKDLVPILTIAEPGAGPEESNQMVLEPMSQPYPSYIFEKL